MPAAADSANTRPACEFDHPLNMTLYRACEELYLPVLFHLDDIRNPDTSGLPRLENALKTFPRLPFIGHAAGFWASISSDATPADFGRYPTIPKPATPGGALDLLMDRYPNLYCDLSEPGGYSAIARDRKFGRDFLLRRVERLLFGTDYLMDDQQIPPLRALRLARLARRGAVQDLPRQCDSAFEIEGHVVTAIPPPDSSVVEDVHRPAAGVGECQGGIDAHGSVKCAGAPARRGRADPWGIHPWALVAPIACPILSPPPATSARMACAEVVAAAVAVVDPRRPSELAPHDRDDVVFQTAPMQVCNQVGHAAVHVGQLSLHRLEVASMRVPGA